MPIPSSLWIMCVFVIRKRTETYMWYIQFSWRVPQSFPFYCFPLFLSNVHLRRPPYLSLLSSGNLHSVRKLGIFFPFSLTFHFSFPQLSVKPSQTTPFYFLISPPSSGVVLITVSCTILTCRVISCVVGRGCLLWSVRFLGKILLAFAFLHFVLKSQTCLFLQVSLDFLFLHSSPLMKRTFFFFLVVVLGIYRIIQLQLL